jgi:hypothetical protein
MNKEELIKKIESYINNYSDGEVIDKISDLLKKETSKKL